MTIIDENRIGLKKEKNKFTKFLFVHISIQFKFENTSFFNFLIYTNFWIINLLTRQCFIIYSPFSPDLQFLIKNGLNIQAIVPYNFRGQPYVF